MTKDKQELRQTYSIDEASAALGISRSLGYRLAREGKLPGVLALGKKRLVVAKGVIDRLLLSGKSKDL